MFDTVTPPSGAPSTSSPMSTISVSPYTAACRRCGAFLRLTDDEVLDSLEEQPICWPCDTARSGPG